MTSIPPTGTSYRYQEDSKSQVTLLHPTPCSSSSLYSLGITGVKGAITSIYKGRELENVGYGANSLVRQILLEYDSGRYGTTT